MILFLDIMFPDCRGDKVVVREGFEIECHLAAGKEKLDGFVGQEHLVNEVEGAIVLGRRAKDGVIGFVVEAEAKVGLPDTCLACLLDGFFFPIHRNSHGGKVTVINHRSVAEVEDSGFRVAFVGQEELDARGNARIVVKDEASLLVDDGGNCASDGQGKRSDRRAAEAKDIHRKLLAEKRSGELVSHRAVDPELPTIDQMGLDDGIKGLIGLEMELIEAGSVVGWVTGIDLEMLSHTAAAFWRSHWRTSLGSSRRASR